MKIVIESIPHSEQRLLGNVGDYWIDPDGTIQIRVSECQIPGLPDWLAPFLIAIHEAIEERETTLHGIKEPDIQAFDERFYSEQIDEKRPSGEAGDAPDSPYRECHRFAENIERLICHQFGLNWEEYSKSVQNLDSMGQSCSPDCPICGGIGTVSMLEGLDCHPVGKRPCPRRNRL